ncbi:hypothetical protein RBB50_003863 [Rhinocladiella similis]
MSLKKMSSHISQHIANEHSEHEAEKKPVKGEIGNELLDPNIRDDHGDPHRAALEDLDDERKVSIRTWIAIFFLGFTGNPSISFTINTVFSVLVPISLELQGSTENVSWMASGWSLAASVAFTLAGQLSDFFGRRDTLLFGQIVLIIGHIIGATSQSVHQGIAAMVILGFGTGTAFVNYPAISELLPNRYRSLGLASTELHILATSAFGPLMARALTKNASWRWIYILGVITGVISFAGTAIFYTPPSRPFLDRSRRDILGELDYGGIFLFTTGTTLFLLGLGWGGTTYPWASAHVLAPLIIGILLFIGTFFWDFYGPVKRPIFPYRLFKKFREFTSLLVVIFVTGLVFISINTLIPEEIAYVFTSDSIKAGIYNIPAGACGALGGTVLGGLLFKIKHVHWQIMTAVAIQSVFTALMALITPDRIAMGVVFQAFTNIPFGWILIACYVTCGLHIPQRDIGLAYGLIGGVRFLGGAVGTAIFTTVVNNRSATTIPSRVITAVTPLGYPADEVPGLIVALSAGLKAELAQVPQNVVSAASEAVRWGYTDAFKIAWLVSIPFGVAAFAVSTFIRDPSLYFTKHTAVTMKESRLGGGKTNPSNIATNIDGMAANPTDFKSQEDHVEISHA